MPPEIPAPDAAERLRGVLWGGALGDAAGLPFENLAPETIRRAWPEGPLRPWLPGRRARISDDTEHALFTIRAWNACGRRPGEFAAALGGELTSWLVAIPPGVGFGTLRAGIKLGLGFGPGRSGVGSGGNGPLMRAPALGVVFDGPDGELDALVDASTRLTHTHPEALAAARLAARLARSGPGAAAELVGQVPAGDTRDAASRALAAPSLAALAEARAWRRGVPGYAPESLAAALAAARAHPCDAAGAVEAAIRLGGDTDSVAGLAGALVGAWAGPGAVPEAWRLALEGAAPGCLPLGQEIEALVRGEVPPRAAWPRRVARNLGLLGLCLLHVPRRLLPGPW